MHVSPTRLTNSPSHVKQKTYRWLVDEPSAHVYWGRGAWCIHPASKGRSRQGAGYM